MLSSSSRVIPNLDFSIPSIPSLPDKVKKLLQPWTTVITLSLPLRDICWQFVVIYHWAPSQRPGLKFQTKDNPLIRDVFPSALQNVELFEASVALCLSFKAAGSNFTTYLCNACLHHKGEALAGIRNKLMSGRVDEAVIFATVLLMIIDVCVRCRCLIPFACWQG